MLITLSGIDGAGKTTQLTDLVDALRADGRHVHTLWMRPGYSPELDALRRIIRKIRPGTLPTPGASDRRAEVFSRPAVQRAWAAVALNDLLLQYAIKLRAWLAGGATVVCDRYLPDARIDG